MHLFVLQYDRYVSVPELGRPGDLRIRTAVFHPRSIGYRMAGHKGYHDKDKAVEDLLLLVQLNLEANALAGTKSYQPVLFQFFTACIRAHLVPHTVANLL
jgi:hypothetical protein